MNCCDVGILDEGSGGVRFQNLGNGSPDGSGHHMTFSEIR